MSACSQNGNHATVVVNVNEVEAGGQPDGSEGRAATPGTHIGYIKVYTQSSSASVANIYAIRRTDRGYLTIDELPATSGEEGSD